MICELPWRQEVPDKWRKAIIVSLNKGNDKLYAAFMDLETAYDRVDKEALWK